MPLILLVAFVVVPLIEIAVLIQVGQVIGTFPALALLLLVSVVGAWLARREGTRAWRALRGALTSGRLPGREVADGALVLVGATLLLTPGFVTDAVGVLLLLPPTRAVLRRALLSWAVRRSVTGAVGPAAGRAAGAAAWRGRPPGASHGEPGASHGGPSGAGEPGPSGPFGGAPRPGQRVGDGAVVEGEVVEDDPGNDGTPPGAGGAPRP